MITISKSYTGYRWEPLPGKPELDLVHDGGVICDSGNNESWYREKGGNRQFKRVAKTGDWFESILQFEDVPVLPGNEVEFQPGVYVEHYYDGGAKRFSRVVKDLGEYGVMIADGQLYRHLHHIREISDLEWAANVHKPTIVFYLGDIDQTPPADLSDAEIERILGRYPTLLEAAKYAVAHGIITQADLVATAKK